MSRSVRIVFDEDGFPRELVTAAERAAAVRADAIGPTSLVTVYRDNESPFVAEAGTLPELRPLFGIEESSEERETVPADPPIGPRTAVALHGVAPSPVPTVVPFPYVASPSSSAVKPSRSTVIAAPKPVRPKQIDQSVTRSQFRSGRSPIAWALNPIVNYAVFEGRAPVREYAGFWAVSLIAMLISAALGPAGLTFAALALAIPSLAVMVRRLHDLNTSGWVVLIVLIPYVGALLLVILLMVPTASLDANRYGASPLRA